MTVADFAVSGILRFVGNRKETGAEVCGVELEENVDGSDGSERGCRYFTCVAGHGVFAVPNCVVVEGSEQENLAKAGGTTGAPNAVQPSDNALNQSYLVATGKEYIEVGSTNSNDLDNNRPSSIFSDVSEGNENLMDDSLNDLKSPGSDRPRSMLSDRPMSGVFSDDEGGVGQEDPLPRDPATVPKKTRTQEVVTSPGRDSDMEI